MYFVRSVSLRAVSETARCQGETHQTTAVFVQGQDGRLRDYTYGNRADVILLAMVGY
jgi:hypothetical protein